MLRAAAGPSPPLVLSTVTSTGASRATATVASLEPSSTSNTSNDGGRTWCASAASVAGSVASALRAGMTTLASKARAGY
jgi:hypothetical protein